MRFSCEKCQARYTIADERVRGRRLRVRCKRCKNAIHLADPALAAIRDASPPDVTTSFSEITSGASTDSEPPPASPVEIEWFAIIDRSETGPLTFEQLSEHARDGRVVRDTFVWREGLDDWAHARDVLDLAALFESQPPLPKRLTWRTESQPPPVAAPQRIDDPLPMPEGTSDDDNGPRAEAGSTPPGGSLFDDAGPFPPPEDEDSPADPNLLNLARELELENGQDAAGGSGGVILGGAAAKAQQKDPFQSVPDAPGLAPVDQAENTNAIIRASGARQRNTGSVVALVLSLLVILGVSGYFAAIQLNEVEPEPAAAVEPARREAPRPVDLSEVGELDAAQLDILTGEAKRREEEEARQAAARRQAAERRRRQDDSVAAALLGLDDDGAIKSVREDVAKEDVTPEQLALLERMRADRRPGTGAPEFFVKDDLEVRRTGTGGPDPANIARKIADNQPAIAQCIAASLRRSPNQKLGKVTITATIAPSGVVTRADFPDRHFGETDLGSCLQRAIKGIVFAPFDGQAHDVEIPLVLGAG